MRQNQKNETYLEDTLEFISHKGYVSDENEFFESMAKFLAKLFNVDYVLIVKYSVITPEIAETVKVYNRDRFLPNIFYELLGTPSEDVIDNDICIYPKNLQTLFPKDKLLLQMNVDSYMGAPLWSSARQPIGSVVLLDSKPLKSLKSIKSILQIVSLKVEKILEKSNFENLLEVQNQSLSSSKERIPANEKKFRQLYRKSADAIFILKNGRIIDCSKGALKMFNFKNKKNIIKLYLADISPKFQPDGMSSFEKYKETAKIVFKKGTHRFEWTYTKSNGEDFPTEILLTAIVSEPKNLVIHSVVRDITERKRNEQEIVEAKKRAQESEKYLNSIINNIGDPVFVKDDQIRLLLVNNAFCELFKLSKEDIIGKTFLEDVTLEEQESFIKVDKQVLLNGKENITEELLTIRENDTLTVSTRKTRFIDANGKKYLIGVSRDISERKLGENELKLAKEKAEESDRLKTEFLHNMSHEIRTPMNGILGFSNFLGDANLSNEKRNSYVKIIQNSGRQLLGIIDDILEISTLETKQVVVKEEKTGLNDLLFELFSIFDLKAKNAQISLYLEKGLSDEQSIVLTDRVKLHKVLSNLLENAIKFTSIGQINFGYELKDTKLEFFVRDTGIGIPENKVKIIFERFSQADKELSKNVGGLGLGLSIAKENVILLGGDLSVTSKVLEGSTFTFDIPYSPFDLGIETPEKGANGETENKLTFLIAEDEEVNFMFVEILLLEQLKLDCDIIRAINGKEAVEICKTNESIDLVLMDLKMPIMSGFKAIKIIKELRPDLPIIAQSAYTTTEDRKRAEDAGCIKFISKPISKEALKDSIHDFIKR
jgi:PAS domain S-box-containing protein